MKDFFKNLLQYNQHYNKQMIDTFRHISERLSEKCISLLSHTVNAHNIWNGRIKSELSNLSTWDVHSIEVIEEINALNHALSATIIEQYELTSPVEYVAKGKAFKHSTADILYQIINHSTYHRAQINTELKQCVIQPLMTDYIYYKMLGH